MIKLRGSRAEPSTAVLKQRAGSVLRRFRPNPRESGVIFLFVCRPSSTPLPLRSKFRMGETAGRPYKVHRRSPSPDGTGCQACFAVVGALSRGLQRRGGHLLLWPRESDHATDGVVWQESHPQAQGLRPRCRVTPTGEDSQRWKAPSMSRGARSGCRIRSLERSIPDNGPVPVESSCLHSILRDVQIAVGEASRDLPVSHPHMSQAAPHLAEAILPASSKPAEARDSNKTPPMTPIPLTMHLTASGKCGGPLFSGPFA